MACAQGAAAQLASPSRGRSWAWGVCALFLLGIAHTAQAADKFCSDAPYFGVIDGNVLANPPTQISVDSPCTFRNWPQSNPLTTTINFNFQSGDPTSLIVFDNVWYTGNMACSNTEDKFKIWFTNSATFAGNNQCQDLFIPVEKIDKQSPAATAAVGVPFTYTLTIPVMFDPANDTVISNTGSPNDLGTIRIWDDLSAAATGAEMTLVSINAYYQGTGVPVPINNQGNSKFLDFTLPDILNGQQIVVEITVVLDDVPANGLGDVFTNTAKWEFSRWVDIDEDGVLDPGEFFNPLPGEWGVSQPMSIAEPVLVVNKSTTATAINVADVVPYTIDVQNAGGVGAWNIQVVDELPAGMCATDPSASLAVSVLAGNGSLVRNLTAGTHYTQSYDAGTCLLSLTTTTAGGEVRPNERLVISFNSQLDPGFMADGAVLTNVAGAVQWFNGSSAAASRRQYDRVLTNGTPGTLDHEDSQVVTAALSGYYFEKTVVNLNTGANPAVTASAGDRLRYRLRLFNVDQNINGITIADPLDVQNSFVASSFSMVTLPVGATHSFDSTTGLLSITGSGSPLNVAQGTELVVEFEITLRPTLANGSVVNNQATLTAIPFTAISDDPYANGVADPDVVGDEDVTSVQIQSPGALAKSNPAKTTATIGEQFTYRITVPASPVNIPLYDVRILDNLSASAADLAFVSANVVSGGSWSLSNTGSGSTVILQDLATGIDIPANGQAVIDVTVVLQNSATNQAGLLFNNTASYSYNRVNGSAATQTAGAGATTANMTVVEPVLAASKLVRNVTPGKAVTDPAAGGDILEYVVTVPNSGSSTAHDVTLTDTLPATLALITGSANAQINGVNVAGFVATPTELTPGVWVWGSANGDDSLDIPVGQSLTLSYRVNVLSATGASINNSVWVDWTSLNGSTADERTGAGCPSLASPIDDYCVGPATATVSTVDTNALNKSVLSDSWTTAPSTVSDGVLRVGDTVIYRLALTLREGQTQNVVVRDTLPAGLLFDGMVSINGDTAAPFAAAPPFTHANIAAPAQAGNTLTWTVGDVFNAIDNNTANDSFIIEYRARVATNTLSHVASSTLTNNAEFSYTGGTTKVDSVAVEVRQPVLVTLTKTDRLGRVGPTSALPLNVNVASDVMQFRLQACNASGSTAPAYSLRLLDTLASQLNETSISTPVVTVNGVAQAAGVDYSYTAPAARGGTMSFVLNTPVNPGQCAVVDYNIGFHTDVAPNQLWNNRVSATEYWSLPAASGQQYAAVGPAEFWMTNSSSDPLPVKTLVSPASEAAIGQAVVYQITIPAINAARSNVLITDTLPSALVYDSASVAGGLSLTDNSVAPGQVSLSIAQIPAGQPAVITLNAHVANDATTNAGNTFSNQASYTYTGYTGPALISAATAVLTIVEPLVSVAKAVTPTTPPVAGNILHYTVDLAASAGATFSGAFDLGLVDTLSLGLAYVPGTATVAGVAVEPTITGDGVSTPQTLSWSAIDLAEGTAQAVEYDVRVLNGVTPSQVLTNNVVARWTSLSGVNANERTGSESPAHNDYVASASTSLGAPDNSSLAKTRLSDTFNAGDANLRIGDRVDYELRIGLQEGTHNDLALSDTLPTGLVFESVLSADFFGTPGTANPVVSGQTLSWNLGSQTNPADGNAANDFIVIVYRARVQNNDVLSQTPTTQTLSNTASLTYTIGGVPVLPKTASTAVTVLQPELLVSKSVATPGGDTVVTAGEVITYTVDIRNNGTAPAYDTVLTDTLPAGLRQGGVSTTAIRLVTAGTVLPVLAPSYNAGTGVATWNFDNGTANTYTIPVGETLRLVYTVQADADVGASLSLSNAATASLYYSFDDEAVPAGGVVAQREVYGPSNTATAVVTTPGPGALLKATTQASASIGDQFRYRITVPAVPVATALHDVRITDDLDASAADLRFISVIKTPATATVNTGSWTPVNTGSLTQLVIEDTGSGIDIPAGEQITVEVTVQLLNTATNTPGLVFSNSADYSYNRVANTPASQAPGLPGTSGDMTIVGPESLTLDKTGPASMRAGTPASFTLNVQNTGAAQAWDITVTDLLPNPAPGGMCDSAPSVSSAQVFAADGTTPVSALLLAGTDYTTSFAAGSGSCTFTITGLSAAASLAPQQRLIISYQAALDADNPPNIPLTNVAGATEWFSQDTAGAGVSGEARLYSRTLSDGSVGTLDHEDAHTLTTEWPTLQIQKRVVNVSTGQNPGSNAQPGDRLRYSVLVRNVSPVPLPNFDLRDDLGALNAELVFLPGSLALTTVPAGADTAASNPNGGSNGAGLVAIGDLVLGAQGSATDTVLVEFEATLAAVIRSGTLVLNQAELSAFGHALGVSDDPNVNGVDDPAQAGDEDPTRTLISSAPQWQVQKVSDDVTGDAGLLLPGDTLRYTLTVKNIGNEDAVAVSLRDLVPANTSYVPNTTTLNGVAVADASAGVSALQAGLLIHAPGNTTPGAMDADAGSSTANVATIVFDVVVNSNAVNGTVISNQGLLNGEGEGSGDFIEQPSDDPATTAPGDATRDIVGDVALLDAQKTVTIQVDNGSPGVADPGDVLRYTITVSNQSSVAASNALLTDAVPANTSYVANSTTLNGAAVADASAGVSALAAGMAVNSPSAASGSIAGGANAVVTFDVQINPGVAAGTEIRNQGAVDGEGLPTELTDADGVDSNGDQPTIIFVGEPQRLQITKEVLVVGGGMAQAGGQLDYLVRVTNNGAVPATQVLITDDLNNLNGQATLLLSPAATLNGQTAGVSYSGGILSADYAGTYGSLQPGATAILRFRVQLAGALAIGDTVSNTGVVTWSTQPLRAESTVTVAIGGIPGTASLNGQVWHDANFNNSPDATERDLAGWSVELFRGTSRLGSTTTDSNGLYRFTGLAPSVSNNDRYELRFVAPGAGLNTAKLGLADSAFSNSLQRISQVQADSGSNLQGLNLPIDPNGVVYDAILRTPVRNASLVMVRAGSGMPVASACFDDPVQQGQITSEGGFYKFDMNFSDASCPSGADYLIQVTPPSNGYVAGISRIIPPLSHAGTTAFAVPSCPGTADDAVTSTAAECEAQPSEYAPALAVAARTAGTNHYLNLVLSNVAMPGDSQIFNNHIPLDPVLDEAVSISKTSALVNVSRGQIVPYVITVNNTLPVTLQDMAIVDTFPAGFKYIAGSARVDGQPLEPSKTNRQLSWSNLALPSNTQQVIKLLFIVGAGVGEGEYVNRARVFNTATDGAVSGEAMATVRVVPDPTFDCTDVIGKVYDDANLNAYQDEGERGLAGVRVATARGLVVTTDDNGRFHITCAMTPDEDRGSNFILKVDDRSLPSGYRITTENPRVQRATRGKMMKFNFGAAIHKVVRMDLANGAFTPQQSELRIQWRSRLDLLLRELHKAPSILRLSYMAEIEDEALVNERLAAIKATVAELWAAQGNPYELTMETEVFWRTGAPPQGGK